MKRFITGLIEALMTAPALFQTVESAPVSRIARRRLCIVRALVNQWPTCK
jgi:hypothetical protein